MPDQYKMVLIGGVSFVVVIFILLAYFKFFAKKNKINYLFILLLLSIVPLVSIFRPGSYESGDLTLHTMRTFSFYNIFFGEHLIPKWTPEFNAGYGDPHFLFAYFLPYFIGSIFHFIGFSFLDSIKLLLALSFILSGVTMYFWAKDELGKKAGFVSALFYLFVPYHLVDLHFRVSIAETLSFVFLPFLLLITKKIIEKPNFNLIIFGAISYGLLILTHQIISMIFSSILICYALFLFLIRKKKLVKNLIFFSLTIILGLLLTAFYWVPIISESNLTQASLSRSVSSFTPLTEMLYVPWRMGFLFQGHYGELGLIIGYTQMFIVAVAIYLLLKKKIDKTKKKLLLFFLTLFLILIFLISPQSAFIWETVPLLKYAQYSYRLLEFVALCTSIIAGIVVTKWNKNSFIIILCFITVVYTMLNWGNRGTIPELTDKNIISSYQNKPDVGAYLEPSSPIWADLQKSKLRIKPQHHIEVINGKAEIKELFRTSTRHVYLINAQTDVTIKENTLYFPGWTLSLNGKPSSISFSNPNQPGVIHFSLKDGLYYAELTFKDTFTRSSSLFVSQVTIILMLVVFIFRKKLTFF